jgi:FAD synthase
MLIEAHLLIENVGDLAVKWLAMDFIERIRNQKRFVSKEALIEQIGADCKQAMHVLPRDSKV